VRIVVKLGGTLLDQPEARKRLATEIARIAEGANQVVVVHGGGKQMTRFLAERGVESRFVDGLRVTTPEVVDALLKVFAGSVNHELVAAFVGAGARAIGLSGIDDALIECELLNEKLGAVGRPVRSRPEVLELLTANGFLPVVACVAGDRQGNVYNVNGDQMAAACAAGFRADRLLFLTDVDGVRGANGAPITALDIADCEALIRDGVATGGMQAKLNACIAALEGGAGQVTIAPGLLPDVVEAAMAGDSVGTRIVREG
jgi:acetylglutamate kinase